VTYCNTVSRDNNYKKVIDNFDFEITEIKKQTESTTQPEIVKYKSDDEMFEEIQSKYKLIKDPYEKKDFLNSILHKKEYILLRPRIAQMLSELDNYLMELKKNELMNKIKKEMDSKKTNDQKRQVLFDVLKNMEFKPIHNQVREILKLLR